MTTPAKPAIRCALYTRKSSEEGLDQSFNSLHAQREACESYVASQRHEGWQALTTLYDDGGFSGGNMDRPGLVRLMADIAAHKVDTVVVYKVDRLTRSLADFAKIVEAFDKQGVSFVSVTQQFNTTSSMGRLTLNILLSFAQFEREVTGERIRDKLAASKKKGMWMGGNLPLGYDCHDRQLVVNPVEAKLVKEIFTQYLWLGSVTDLKQYLDRKGLCSKSRVSAAGKKRGGMPLGRGALYHLLSNPIYVGDISHKKVVYRGKHEAILDRELWDKVAARLKLNIHNPEKRGRTESGSLLAGLLFDVNNVRYTPHYSIKKGRRYRYYVSQAVIKRDNALPPVPRISAPNTERIVSQRILDFLQSPQELSGVFGDFDISGLRNLISLAALKAAQMREASTIDRAQFIRSVIRKIVVCQNSIDIEIGRDPVQSVLLSQPLESEGGGIIRLNCVFMKIRRGNEMRLTIQSETLPNVSGISSELKSLARGHQWLDLILEGECSSYRDISKRTGLTESFINRTMKYAFMPFEAQETIIKGSTCHAESS